MPSDASERKATKSTQLGAPQQEPEHLPCPRCDSTNTKFCYYNNYNFSQPRHFCKSCRRYWTHGGTLRDIPVGGGSRKNAKRSRTTGSAASVNVSPGSFSSPHDFRHLPISNSQFLVPVSTSVSGDHGGAVSFVGDAKPGLSFTSLLNTQGTGLFSLGGFGLGIGPGLEDVGFGVGRAVWPFQSAVEGGASSGNVGNPTVMGNTWQLENGDSGFVGGDCFTLPDLAISTPGNGMK